MEPKTVTPEQVAELRKARPELFTESEDAKKLRETADAEKARADKAEKALKESEDRQKANATVSSIVDKVLNESGIPAYQRTSVLIEQLATAGTEDRMKAVLEDRRAWGRDADAGRTGRGINREVPSVQDDTGGGSAGKPLYESDTKALAASIRG